MKPENAIEILGQDANTHLILNQPDQANATALGREALAFYLIMKLKGCFDPAYLLPGETKE